MAPADIEKMNLIGAEIKTDKRRFVDQHCRVPVRPILIGVGATAAKPNDLVKWTK